MTCTKFKLTTVAALVLAATNANAALYKVVEVTPFITGASEIFGVAIQPGVAKDAGDVELAKGCFDSNAANCADSTFKLAGETRNAVDGIGYREEVPFAMDAPFQYIQERDDFENYCYRELRYSTCESWADNRWATWSKESNLSYVNAKAFVENGSSISSYNVAITALDDSGVPVGIESNGSDIRYNAVTTVPLTASSESRAFGALTVDNAGTDIIYNFGSISTKGAKTDTSDITFSSKAAIWKDGEVHQFTWIQGDTPQTGDYFAQGSMRGLVANSGKLFGVGYDTVNGNGDLQDMNASVFVSDSLDITGATWTTKVISGAEVKSGS
ncbi:GlyGly-CTERM sorting domain-containing protein, partial [Vibrio splendidus]